MLKHKKNKVQDVQAHQQREKGIKPKLKIKNSEKKNQKYRKKFSNARSTTETQGRN